jgi:hypothetical protein
LNFFLGSRGPGAHPTNVHPSLNVCNGSKADIPGGALKVPDEQITGDLSGLLKRLVW